MSETRTLRIKVVGDGKSGESVLERTAHGLEDVAKSANKSGKEVDGLGGKLKGLTDKFRRVGENAAKSMNGFKGRRVDAEIAIVTRSLKQLGAEYERTGNKDLFKKIRADRSVLSNLKMVQRELDKVGEAGTKSGEDFSKLFGGAMSDLPPQVQAAIVAGGAGAVALLAPLIGASITGAIVGGVGLGGVVGGIAIAASNPEVQKAAAATGQLFKGTLQNAAADFVPAVEDSLDIIDQEIRDLSPSFKRVFSKAAEYVRPLTLGVTGFAEKLMPGVEAAVQRAQPIINEVASWGPRLGSLISDVLTVFSEHAYEGAQALEALWEICKLTIEAFAGLVLVLTETYKWMQLTSWAITGQLGKLIAYASGQKSAEISAAATAIAQSNLNSAVDAGTAMATAAAEAVKAYRDSLYELANVNLTAREATRQMEAAIDAARDAVKENGKILDINTAKGRANAEALDAIAAQANRASDAVFKQTGSADQAAAVQARARQKFLETAASMGLAASKANALADQLFAIPNVERDVKVDPSNAVAGAKKANDAIDSIHGKTVSIQVKAQISKVQNTLDRLGGGYASGGLVEGPGTGTSDDVPADLSDGEYVLRAAAVKRLGVKFLDGLNRGKVQRFANGGRVRAHRSRYIKDGAVSTSFQRYVDSAHTRKTLAYGSVSAVNAQSSKILDQVTGSLDKSVRSQLAKLKGYASQREAIAKKLDDAKKKLADAIATRDDYKAQVRDQAIQAANITTGNTDVTNSGLVLANLRAKLDKTKQFRTYLASLQKLGINADSYKQIVDAGVDGGYATAKALAEGGSSAVSSLNSLQGQLNTAADGLGSDSSKRLYQAGVDAASGLVKGLQSQEAALNKASAKLADTIIKKLKTVLKIKSPSRLLASEVGEHLPTGIAMGVDDKAHVVGDSLRKAVTVQGLADASVRAAPSISAGQTVYVTVNVAGHVTTEKKLADAIAPHVRDAVVRRSRNNGGRTGF